MNALQLETLSPRPQPRQWPNTAVSVRALERTEEQLPHRVLLVGTEAERAGLRDRLYGLPGEFIEHDWSEEVETLMNEGVVAVVLAGHPPGVSTPILTRSLSHQIQAHHLQPCPIFVVLPTAVPDQWAWAVYDAGATLVLGKKARKSDDLPELLAQVFARYVNSGPSKTVGGRLERHIAARLELAEGDYSGVDVDVGVYDVSAAGIVMSGESAERLRKLIERVPGVREVDVEQLRTQDPQGVEARASIHDAISRAVGEPTAVAWNLEQGTLTLAGSVGETDELEALGARLSEVEGIEELDNYVVVSPRQRDADAEVARRARARLLEVNPDTDLEVQVFGGIAVLRGEGASPKERRQACALIDVMPTIKRVVEAKS